MVNLTIFGFLCASAALYAWSRKLEQDASKHNDGLTHKVAEIKYDLETIKTYITTLNPSEEIEMFEKLKKGRNESE